MFDRIDDYINDLFGCSDAVLQAALERSDEAGLPQIQVSGNQGKLLCLFAKMVGARRILEIGTLSGYSTIWLTRGLAADGSVVTLEVEASHAAVAVENFKAAGIGDKVQVIVGPALESLPKLADESQQPFDLVFIDANKEAYPEYLHWAVRLTRPGGVILADNVIRAGAVLDPDSADEQAVGASQFNADLAAHPQLDSVVLQQVGAKGHDGLAIAVVND